MPVTREQIVELKKSPAVTADLVDYKQALRLLAATDFTARTQATASVLGSECSS